MNKKTVHSFKTGFFQMESMEVMAGCLQTWALRIARSAFSLSFAARYPSIVGTVVRPAKKGHSAASSQT